MADEAKPSRRDEIQKIVNEPMNVAMASLQRATVLALLELIDAVDNLTEATQNSGPCQHRHEREGSCVDCGEYLGR